MGVNISSIIKSNEIDLQSLHGNKVAVDAYNTIFQFLSAIRQRDGSLLQDQSGHITSHLSGILYRTLNMIEAGVEPIFVFDGTPNRLKINTIKKRIAIREKAKNEYKIALADGDIEKAFSKSQQTSKITPDILNSSKKLIELLGIPIVKAPSDGEAQAAYLCMRGDAYATVSQDFDSILFGSPILIRNVAINGRRKIPGRNIYKDIKTELIDSVQMLKSLGITREQLVDVCIMIGTDFNCGVKGIGPKKGLRLIKECNNLENVMRRMDLEINDYEIVKEIFLDGPKSDNYSVDYTEVDVDGVLDLMTTYGFSAIRIDNALKRIKQARESESIRKKQKCLDSWL